MDVVINNKEMNQAKFEEIFATMDELQQEMNEQEEAEEIETFGIEALNEIRNRSLQPVKNK